MNWIKTIFGGPSTETVAELERKAAHEREAQEAAARAADRLEVDESPAIDWNPFVGHRIDVAEAVPKSNRSWIALEVFSSNTKKRRPGKDKPCKQASAAHDSAAPDAQPVCASQAAPATEPDEAVAAAPAEPEETVTLALEGSCSDDAGDGTGPDAPGATLPFPIRTAVERYELEPREAAAAGSL